MKKRMLIVCCFSFCLLIGYSQDRTFSPFYHQRVSLFEKLPVTADDIIFLGNSLTNGCEWHELLDNKHIKNRGISGDVTMGVYNRLDPIVNGKPAKIFLLIGVNDISWGMPADSIAGNIRMIVEKIKRVTPATKIYLQSALPFDDDKGMYKKLVGRFGVVAELNMLIKEIAIEASATYIDLYPHFIDPHTGKLDGRYSNDGLHLLGDAYLIWRDRIIDYVNE